MSDAEIIIGADASKLVRELRTAQDEFDRLTRAQQRAGGAAGALDGALAKAKTRLDAASAAAHKAGVGVDAVRKPAEAVERTMAGLAKGAALTGSAFGSLSGPLGDVGDAFQLMPAPIAAVTVGLAGLVAIGYGFATMALDAARNAEELSDSLGDNKVAAIAAGRALEAMDQELRTTSTTIGSYFAPAVEDGANAVSGLARITTDAANGLQRSGLTDWMWSAIDAATNLSPKLAAIKIALGGLAAYGSEVIETVSTDPESMTADELARQKAMQDRLAAINRDGINERLSMMQKEYEDKKKAAEKAERDAEQRADEAERRAKERARQAEQHARDEAQRLHDLIGINARVANERERHDEEWAARTKANMRLVQEQTKEAEEAARRMDASMTGFAESAARSLDEAGQSWVTYNEQLKGTAVDNMSTTERMNQDIGQLAGAVKQFADYAISITRGVVDLLATIQENGGNRSREALRKQFKARKAAAIAEAVVNTALAATQALATPPIWLGIILAALAVASGGVQIANIAAQQPTFHVGGIYRDQGMAPDERAASLRMRENEAVILTQQAMGSMASQLGRLNAGESARSPASVVVMLDGSAQRTRGFARPDPGYGHAMIGGA